MSWRTPRTWLRSVLQRDPRERASATISLSRDQPIENSTTAIDLIAKEQLSIAQRLPEYLDEVREEMRGTSPTDARALHNSTVAALKEVEGFTERLSARDLNPSRSLELSRLAERSDLLRSLSDSVCELTETMRPGHSGPLGMLTGNIAEGLHAVLLAAADAVANPDEANLELLHQMTADRGELMEAIRRSLLRGEQTLTIDEHQALFTSTRLFERIIRLLRRLHTVEAASTR
jgi:phosphate:Na+ symporter